MASTAEQRAKVLNSIKIPERFKETPVPYQAGRLDGRTDILEDLAKFAQALLDKAEQERANGDEPAAQKTAAAGGALAAFSQDYIQRMREGRA